MSQISPQDDDTDREANIGGIMAIRAVLGLLVGFFTTYDAFYTVIGGILLAFFLGFLLAKTCIQP